MNNEQLATQFLSGACEIGRIPGPRTAGRELRYLFQDIDLAGKRLLDIGGGDGFYSFYAAGMGAREVVCLEPSDAGGSDEALSTFQKMKARFPQANVTLDTRLIQQFSAAQPFDIVLMHASINHIDEEACIHLLADRAAWAKYREQFTAISALLVKGGFLIVSDCARQNFFDRLGLQNPLCPTIEWHKHQQPGVWARLLAEVGFQDPKIHWEPVYRLGKAGEILTGNQLVSFFLRSAFRMHMRKA